MNRDLFLFIFYISQNAILRKDPTPVPQNLARPYLLNIWHWLARAVPRPLLIGVSQWHTQNIQTVFCLAAIFTSPLGLLQAKNKVRYISRLWGKSYLVKNIYCILLWSYCNVDLYFICCGDAFVCTNHSFVWFPIIFLLSLIVSSLHPPLSLPSHSPAPIFLISLSNHFSSPCYISVFYLFVLLPLEPLPLPPSFCGMGINSAPMYCKPPHPHNLTLVWAGVEVSPMRRLAVSW